MEIIHIPVSIYIDKKPNSYNPNSSEVRASRIVLDTNRFSYVLRGLNRITYSPTHILNQNSKRIYLPPYDEVTVKPRLLSKKEKSNLKKFEEDVYIKVYYKERNDPELFIKSQYSPTYSRKYFTIDDNIYLLQNTHMEGIQEDPILDIETISEPYTVKNIITKCTVPVNKDKIQSKIKEEGAGLLKVENTDFHTTFDKGILVEERGQS